MSTAQLRRLQRVEARTENVDALPAWVDGTAATAFVAAPVTVAREWWIRALATMRERRPPASSCLALQQEVSEANAAGALRTPAQEALMMEFFEAMEAVWADRRERAALLDTLRREPWQTWAEGRG